MKLWVLILLTAGFHTTSTWAASGRVIYYSRHYGSAPQETWTVSCSKDPFDDAIPNYCSIILKAHNISILFSNDGTNLLKVGLNKEFSPGQVAVRVDQNKTYVSSAQNEKYEIEIEQGTNGLLTEMSASKNLYVRLTVDTAPVTTWTFDLKKYTRAFEDFKKQQKLL